MNAKRANLEPEESGAKDKMLKTSAKLFATKGYDRVSVRDIAKACRCNVSMVSYYFGGKEKLYQAVFDRFFERVNSKIESLEKEQGDDNRPISKSAFIEDIRQNIRYFVSEFSLDPYAKIVIHREVMDGFPRARASFDKHFANVKDRVFKFYERAQKSGSLKKNVHIPTFVILINGCIESYLVAHMFAKPIKDITIDPLKDTDHFVEQLEEIFLRGVLS